MTAERLRLLRIAAVVVDLLAVLAILVIATYGTLHHETGFYDKVPSPERTLTYLWLLWGLIPAFAITFATTYPWSLHPSDPPATSEGGA